MPVAYSSNTGRDSMRYYYICEIIGDGSCFNPYRPAISKYGKCGMIDLRADSTRQRGLCLSSIDVPVQTQSNKIVPLTLGNIADELDKSLGLNLGIETLPEYLLELLTKGVEGKSDLCKPIRKMIDGEYRIYLHGEQLYGKPPVKYRKGTITDDFNRDDADALGQSSEGWSWVETEGDIDIVSNRASPQTSGRNSAYADESDPTTDDHYAQSYQYGSTDNYHVICVRFENGGQYDSYQFGYSAGGGSWTMQKRVNGSSTELDSEGSATEEGTYYLEADGSSLVGKYGGVTKCSASDSDIDTNTHCGLYSYDNGGKWDNFEAGDLGGGGGLSIPVAMHHYTKNIKAG